MNSFECLFRSPIYVMDRIVLRIAGHGTCRIEDDKLVLAGYGTRIELRRLRWLFFGILSSALLMLFFYLTGETSAEVYEYSIVGLLLAGPSFRLGVDKRKEVREVFDAKGVGSVKLIEGEVLRIDLPGIGRKWAAYLKVKGDPQEAIEMIERFKKSTTAR